MFHCRYLLSVCVAGAVFRVVWNVKLRTFASFKNKNRNNCCGCAGSENKKKIGLQPVPIFVGANRELRKRTAICCAYCVLSQTTFGLQRQDLPLPSPLTNLYSKRDIKSSCVRLSYNKCTVLKWSGPSERAEIKQFKKSVFVFCN